MIILTILLLIAIIIFNPNYYYLSYLKLDNIYNLIKLRLNIL